jgi:hypothetical protein
MTATRPPALATWLLKYAARGNDALVGDLFEEHRRRGSDIWYWRQVLTAVVLNLSREALLVLGVVALFLIGSWFSVPGARADTLTLLSARAAGRPFGPLSLLTGGQLFLGVTVFALGIMPYASASLIVQAFALIWRFLNRNGRRRREVPVVAVTWCAATIAHDSFHSKLYHDYLKAHGQVPDDVWTGIAAEQQCMKHQLAVMEHIGAAKSEIDYAKTQADGHYANEKRTW